MKKIGIICEYNPFHNGHIYHIEKIKEKWKDSIIILVMSGNYTQRGTVSILDKWDKTDIALKYVDLVVELPFVFTIQSADTFAKGAIEILNSLKNNPQGDEAEVLERRLNDVILKLHSISAERRK